MEAIFSSCWSIFSLIIYPEVYNYLLVLIDSSEIFSLKLSLISFYLFLAVLGLHYCARASSNGEWGYSLVEMVGFSIAVASLVAK